MCSTAQTYSFRLRSFERNRIQTPRIMWATVLAARVVTLAKRESRAHRSNFDFSDFNESPQHYSFATAGRRVCGAGEASRRCGASAGEAALGAESSHRIRLLSQYRPDLNRRSHDEGRAG